MTQQQAYDKAKSIAGDQLLCITREFQIWNETPTRTRWSHSIHAWGRCFGLADSWEECFDQMAKALPDTAHTSMNAYDWDEPVAESIEESAHA